MAEQIGFGIIAAGLLLSALFVVSSRNLVHAVLWLAMTLSMTAVLFVFLGAPFLAGIQILLYTGGIITLMLFGVMLTRRAEGVQIPNEEAPHRKLPALLAAASFFGLVAAAMRGTPSLPKAEPAAPTKTDLIGESFLTEHLLAFEVLSVLLLAAMVGAIVIARRHDAGAEPERVTKRRIS
jgi:NADH-quinone oxidoreductase subunit J